MNGPRWWKLTLRNKEKTPKSKETTYFKLPFVGKYSEQTKAKINNIIKRFCKENVRLKIVFTSFKIKQYFSTKDRIPLNLKSMVVYKFSCAGCGSSYIGETTRHLSTRVDEHIKRDKNSHIFKHLNGNESCVNALNSNSFSIIDSANNAFDLKIKEALHIIWDKPDLNTQVHHFSLSLC